MMSHPSRNRSRIQPHNQPRAARSGLRHRDWSLAGGGILTLALALAADSASAGAWPREEGEFFFSIGGNAALFGDAVRPVHYDPTFYLEYGLTQRITIGTEGYTADVGKSGSVFDFARFALGSADRNDRYAVSIAHGFTVIPTGEYETMGRIGLHWGLGLETGWIAVDAFTTRGFRSGRVQSKADVTWGYRFDADWTAITYFQAGTGLEGDLYAKISPSVSYRWNDSIDLRLGLTHALTGDRGGGLLVETWIRF